MSAGTLALIVAAFGFGLAALAVAAFAILPLVQRLEVLLP